MPVVFLCGSFARISNESTSRRTKAGAAVIDDTMAERMVACGWIGAAIAGVLMVFFSFVVGLGFGWPYLILGAVLFALSYGIYRRSRICAVLVLVNHFLGLAQLFTRTRYLPPGIIVGYLLLATLFVLGVIGTFAHHAHRSAQTA
jgi:hypothetical protein